MLFCVALCCFVLLCVVLCCFVLFVFFSPRGGCDGGGGGWNSLNDRVIQGSTGLQRVMWGYIVLYRVIYGYIRF